VAVAHVGQDAGSGFATDRLLSRYFILQRLWWASSHIQGGPKQ